MEDTKRNRFASTGVRSDSKRGIHNDSLMGVLLKAVHDSRHFKSTGSNEHRRSLVEVERQAHGLCSEPIMAACYDCVLICASGSRRTNCRTTRAPRNKEPRGKILKHTRMSCKNRLTTSECGQVSKIAASEQYAKQQTQKQKQKLWFERHTVKESRTNNGMRVEKIHGALQETLCWSL